MALLEKNEYSEDQSGCKKWDPGFTAIHWVAMPELNGTAQEGNEVIVAVRRKNFVSMRSLQQASRRLSGTVFGC